MILSNLIGIHSCDSIVYFVAILLAKFVWQLDTVYGQCNTDVPVMRFYFRPSVYAGVTSITSGSDNCVDSSTPNEVICDTPTLLSNGITGPASPDLSTSAHGRQFVAFTNQSINYLTIAPVSNTTVISTISLHLNINPNDNIGLPNMFIFSVQNPASLSSTTPLEYDIINNAQLSQETNAVRQITFRLRSPGPANGIVFAWNHNDLQNSEWLIVSEVSLCSDTVAYSTSSITFQNPRSQTTIITPQSPLISNGRATLTCTVSNEGSFMWRWYAGSALLSPNSQVTILTAHATTSGVLNIPSVIGTFLCQVSFTATVQYYTRTFIIIRALQFYFFADIFGGVVSTIPGSDNCVTVPSQETRCTAPTVLSNNDVGPMNPDLFTSAHGRQFVAWTNDNNSHLTFAAEGGDDIPSLSTITFHMNINPDHNIGVPNFQISNITDVPNHSPSTPLQFDILNNALLSQENNTVRPITFRLRSPVTAPGFLVTWNYNNLQNTEWLIVSEVSISSDDTLPQSFSNDISFLNPTAETTIVTLDSPLINNGRVTLTCTVSNEGSFMWRWSNESGIINTNVQGVTLLSAHATTTSILTIPVSLGTYQCQASLTFREEYFSRTFIITSELETSITGNHTYSFQDTAVIQCSVASNGLYSYQWSKDGDLLEGEVSNTLTLPNITSSSGGLYTCLVNSSNSEGTARVNVTVRPYFTSPFVNVGGTMGAHLNLTCQAEAFPSVISYRWEKTEGSIRVGVLGVNSSTLVFEQLQLEDQGDYICTVNSTLFSRTSDPATVTVAPFNLLITPPNTYSQGSDVSLNCSAEGSPTLFFRWLFNNSTLPQQTSSLLNLANVNASHGGTYTCMSFNTAGSSSEDTEVFVSPYFVSLLQDLNIINGSQQVLACEAESFPAPAYEWVKLNVPTRSVVISNDRTLQFTPIVFGDEGTYYCNVTSQGISIQSNSITITLAPYIYNTTENQTYNRGDSVTLNCYVLGGPSLFYQWQFTGADLVGANTSSLYLSNVNASHGGVYTCNVANSAGNDSVDVSVFISPYFITQPQDVHFSNGSSVSLVCEAESFPEPTYQWSRSDGRTLRDQVAGTNSTMLTFEPLQFGDEGSYICNVTSQGISIHYVITISVAFYISNISESQTYSRGDSVTLNCYVLGSSSLAYQWQFAGADLVGANTSSLNLSNVNASHGGVYTCNVFNSGGNDSADVSVFISPYFIIQPQDVRSSNGSSVSLVCEAESFPEPTYQWARTNGCTVRDQVAGTNSTMLVFNSLLFGDEGNYFCIVTSQGITIQYMATITIAPYISNISESQTYNRGDSITLNCYVLGGPSLYYQWQFAGADIVGANTSSLYLSNVNASHGGVYTCNVANSAGNDSADVSVFISPYFITEPQDVRSSNGSSVSLVCEAESSPQPTYQWSRSDGRTLRDQVAGTSSTMLTFNVLQFGDEGSYFCKVTSQGNVIQRRITLIISPEGSLMATPPITTMTNSSHLLSCTALGGPNNNFQWRKKGMVVSFTPQINVIVTSAQSGGSYDCVVSNPAGSDSITTYINVAPILTNFSGETKVVLGDSSEISCMSDGYPVPSVTWYHNGTTIGKEDTDIINNGTDIRNNVTDIGSIGTDIVQNVVINATITSTLRIFTAEVKDSGEYICNITSSVTAFNYTQAVISVVVQAVPERPVNLRAVNNTATEIKLTWMEPYSHNAPILFYSVRYSQPIIVQGFRSRTLRVTEQTLTVSNLFPGIEYTFTVTAHNEIGSSAPSVPLVVSTLMEDVTVFFDLVTSNPIVITLSGHKAKEFRFLLLVVSLNLLS